MYVSPSLFAAPSVVLFKCYIYISRVNQALSSKPNLSFPTSFQQEALTRETRMGTHGEQPTLLKLVIIVNIINIIIIIKVRQESASPF